MLECDLIMKGGITSGIVYPHAITEIAGKYRLRNIGGTSAGAIGAVIAASAEYRRQSAPPGQENDGFSAICSIPDELGQDLQSLFQPTGKLQSLYDILIALINAPKGRNKALVFLQAAAMAYKGTAVLFAAPGLLIAAYAYWNDYGLGAIAFGLLLALVVLIAAVAFRIYKNIADDLPENDFGLCTGLRTQDTAVPAFTDWMADQIDRVAGKIGPDGSAMKPLTIGDLKKYGIGIASMTTDLSSNRPYQLPLRTKIHYFSQSEFRRLFPQRVVDYLVEKGEKRQSANKDEPQDLYRLPVGDDFPVLLVARMSLSFPGLISAVPLYRVDYTRTQGGCVQAPMKRCIFSDGGISSNFPIHFFDALVPSRPTFGIALTGYEAERHGENQASRTSLPQKPLTNSDTPVFPVTGITGFLSSIVNTAKDWQDSLQSLLPGYSERIVQIRLDDASEGGLHLTMDADTIKRISMYGRQAGKLVANEFSFDEHRYRRAISSLPAMEGLLDKFSANYDAPPWPDDGNMTYEQILTTYDPKSYSGNEDDWRTDTFDAFAKTLAGIGRKAREAPAGKSVRGGDVPHADSDIRLVASPDRVPADVDTSGGSA